MGFDEKVQKPKDAKGCFPLILMTLGLPPHREEICRAQATDFTSGASLIEI